MSLLLVCPNCQKKLKVPDHAAGRKVKCPDCQTAFEAPIAAQAHEPAATIREPTTQPPPAPRMTAPRYEEDVLRPRSRYQDDDEVPPLRREDRAEPTRTETGAQLGLGIASLAVGIVGLVLAMIPCVGWIGLPIAGLGLILGVAGLIISLVRNGQAIGFPISGTAVSLVAVILASVWLFVAHRLFTHQNRENNPPIERRQPKR